MMPTLEGRTKRIVEAARTAGFAWVAAAPAGPATHGDAFRRWLDDGCAGEMDYMARSADVRADPRLRFDWLRSVLVVAMPYDTDPLPGGREEGHVPALISRYARGDDYHEIIEKRLKRLAALCRDECGAGHARYYVDTGPVLERDWAARAGIGFQGKNAMVIRPGAGSWFFLGEILLDIELESTRPPASEGCGSCRLCIDACPTDAFVKPYVVDARRCVSYLNIELRGSIPAQYRAAMGHRLFGCDTCQVVCPYNRTESPEPPPEFRTRRAYQELRASELIEITEERFRELFRGSPIRRAGRSGIRRNALIVCANLGLSDAIDPTRRCLADPDPVLRGTAAWALARLQPAGNREPIAEALESETDPQARDEMLAALET